MTTVAAARTALASAVSASAKETNGTACYVTSGGTDFTRLGGSSCEWTFRVTCAVGWNSDWDVMETALATLVAAKVTILQASSLYHLASVGAASTRQIGGGDHLTADISVTCRVDI